MEISLNSKVEVRLFGQRREKNFDMKNGQFQKWDSKGYTTT